MGDIIKDIKKNNNEIIRIEVSEFKGRDLINIRIWYQSIDGGSGDVVYKPTQKGITLNISEYDELRDGIERLGNYIQDQKTGSIPEQPEEQESGNEEEDNEKSEDTDKDEE